MPTKAVRFGQIVDHHVLSYGNPRGMLKWQWGGQSAEEETKGFFEAAASEPPSHAKGPMRWYWGDLAADFVRPFDTVFPHEGTILADLSGVQYDGFHSEKIPDRWRIHSGYFWGTQAYNSLGSSGPRQLYRLQVRITAERSERGRTEVPSSPKARTVERILPDPKSWDSRRLDLLEELPRLAPHQRYERFEVVSRFEPFMLDIPHSRTYDQRVPHDILPLSDRRLHFFACRQVDSQRDLDLSTDNEMSIWQYDFEPVKERESGRLGWRGEWRRVERFGVDFIEPFHVVQYGSSYFFVTDSGAVYFARKDAQGRWRSEVLWKHDFYPIVALLVEADTSRAFAFGRDFYFALTPDFKHRSCQSVTSGPSVPGDPMRTVFRCAQVIHEASELENPDEVPQ